LLTGIVSAIPDEGGGDGTNNQVPSITKIPDPTGFISNDTNIHVIDEALTQSGATTTIFALLIKIGISISIIVILLFGVKWALASPAKRADLKQSIAPIIIGIALLFCGAKLGKIVVDILNGIFAKDIGAAINDTTKDISGIIFSAGTGIILIVILVCGVQWLAASPAKKAELKGKMWNIVIGVGILFCTTLILSVIGTFFEGII
jgi:hypothetical protein